MDRAEDVCRRGYFWSALAYSSPPVPVRVNSQGRGRFIPWGSRGEIGYSLIKHRIDRPLLRELESSGPTLDGLTFRLYMRLL